jgi:hypothetical protein
VVKIALNAMHYRQYDQRLNTCHKKLKNMVYLVAALPEL